VTALSVVVLRLVDEDFRLQAAGFRFRIQVSGFRV